MTWNICKSMPCLLLVLGASYTVSLTALLISGMVPGIPWAMLLSFTVHSIQLAVTLAVALTRLESRAAGRFSFAWPPLGIFAGLMLVWFFNLSVHPVVIIPLVLFAVWQFVVGPAKKFVVPLGLSLAALLLGYGTIWNINYLVGKFLPENALCDQRLLDFDVELYRDGLGHDVGGQAGLYFVPTPVPLRFLEHAYMYYYDEIFLVLLILLYRGADLARFFGIMFATFLIGIPVFLLYPTIGPFTFAPETISPTWHESNTYSLMSRVLQDWQAVRSGGALGGYGYFIAMPSMHVAVAVVLQTFAWRCKPAFWLLVPVNVLLMLSTFLLGWHYVLDVPAGIAVGTITLLGARLWDRWKKSRGILLRSRADREPSSTASLPQKDL